MLGLPVSSATSPAEVVHKVRLLGKKDLVIAVSYGAVCGRQWKGCARRAPMAFIWCGGSRIP